MRKHPPVQPGDKFGRLTVIELSHKKFGHSFFVCVCSCGRSSVVVDTSLKAGKSRSCGCLQKEVASSIFIHGFSRVGGKSHEYNAWLGIKKRCYNPNTENYSYYGGRGITVCERWLDSFENFLEDMGLSPGKGWSIERKGNSGNYEKSNCCWATHTQQMRNTRRNHLVTFNNKTLCLSEWDEETGIPHTTLRKRLRMGWTEEEALTTPVGVRRTRND